MGLELVRLVETFPENEDKTEKFLFETEDGKLFESVLIHEDPKTLCVSSQVGCPKGCGFCRTGSQKFQRNLDIEEIVGQVRSVEDHTGRDVPRVSYMGMGEPLLNFDTVLESMDRMEKMYKLSTTVVPGKLDELAGTPHRPEFYVSIHAPTPEKRKKLMPVGCGLEQAVEEVNTYTNGTGSEVNIWYLMLEGFNDSEEDLQDLIELLGSIDKLGTVYLKEYCETGMGFSDSPLERVQRFTEELESAGIETHYSVSEGQKIDAGCGQLKQKAVSGGDR